MSTIAERKRQLLSSHLIDNLVLIIIEYARPFVDIDIPDNDTDLYNYDSLCFTWKNSKYTSGRVNIRGTRLYFIHPAVALCFSSPRQYNSHYNSPFPALLTSLKCT